MSSLVLTRRDIVFFGYLHTYKVATTRQITRDVFKSDYSTCYKRIRKFVKLKFITSIPTDRTLDQSLAYTLTTKGMKVVTSNFKSVIDGKRFKSNSITHDLKLVNLAYKLRCYNMVKEYYTENQIQTYKNFSSQDEMKIFKEMRVDAVMEIQAQGKPQISVPLELEISVKSVQEYQKKIREIYYHKGVKFLLYVCDDAKSKTKIKKIELDLVKDQKKKIFFITFDELLSSLESVTFINQDNVTFRLT